MTFFDVFSLIISVLILVIAFLAINAKKLIHSVIYLSALSMLAVVAFILMKAPDVAITEAVIGSGLVTALFIFVLLSIKRRDAK
ncbi:MAG: sodium:proton antiporter [Tenericutes bacterium GWC2_34_14]|nr:MAG: sodium:proton antiporter [Tenericutes bacterium GWC2_34_14]OHE33319.1 MAG: sodium:proton antiporter [Tenericutes bacterium GWE2_34_108]OHE36470.1 MAG: sodium:proton antiporter [Tenericutes bacterium GWF1_35_14]OHE37674.1 MAG: sodium:proton antiporter [Tenericutes bacterium GWF2_35_184]OHE45049.1 MAG: sodium:proton antiporter [Tenericutes bacterium RIFOXYA2_FULL_36_32]OHE45853.1 MAG: sodium:proton antiporter [Tenericutes bacterium RIFOXYA12_FULL_35_10]OHE49057.1 MAG: sodium:proton anti